MRCWKCGNTVQAALEYSFELVIADHEDQSCTMLVNCYNKMATTMFGMTAAEFLVLNNTERDALREPWRVRPLFAKCALELQENDEVRVTLFGLRKLPYSYLAPA